MLRLIGEVVKGNLIVMNIVMIYVDGDFMFGVFLWISLGNGIIENVKIVVNKFVRSIKKRFEYLGVFNVL